MDDPIRWLGFQTIIAAMIWEEFIRNISDTNYEHDEDQHTDHKLTKK